MEELHIVGVDLAKRVFQVHGSDRAGHVLFRKKLSRPQFIKFLSEIPSDPIGNLVLSHWVVAAKVDGH